MQQELPRSFMNVIARDCWLWHHLDDENPLISNNDQDRLLTMPSHEILEPFGQEWAIYARTTAEELEQERRWLEAQAYWFASAQLLAQSNYQSSDLYSDAITGIVRTGGYSAGLTPTAHAFETLIDEGLQSLSVPIQRALVMSLLRIGTIRDIEFEDLGLSSTSRIHLSQILSPLQEQQRIKGSHNIFDEAVRVYSQQENSLHVQIDEVAVHPTLDTVRGQRNKIIERLNKLRDVALDPERTFLVTVQSLLGAELTTFLKAQEETLGDTYEAWKRRLTTVIEDAHALGSHLVACCLLPLVLSVDRAVYSHLLNTVHSRLPELELQLLKPQVRWHGSTLTVEIKLMNRGAGLARDCILSLSRSETIELDQAELTFGPIEAGQVRVESCSVLTKASLSGISLMGTLGWRDRLGAHHRSEVLKVERQRDINWEALSNVATLYASFHSRPRETQRAR